jgi:hypothetical protein
MPAARWMNHPRGSGDMSSTVGFKHIFEQFYYNSSQSDIYLTEDGPYIFNAKKMYF